MSTPRSRHVLAWIRSPLWIFGLLIGVLPAAAASQSPTLARGEPLKVITCNVRIPFDADKETGDGWDQRQQLCRDVITQQNADIICLQEARAPHLSFFELEWTDYERFGLADPRVPGSPMLPGLSIYYRRSRLEKTDGGGFWLSETPEVAGSRSWGSAGNVYVNWVQLRDRQSGREWRIWNTHLDAKSADAREQQARLAATVSSKLPFSLGQVLAGDFNARASEAPIAAILSTGWNDSYAEVHGADDPGFTFHGFFGPDYPRQREGSGILGKIDFIFTRGAIKVLDAAVIRDGRDGHYPSDHYFVSAVLSAAE